MCSQFSKNLLKLSRCYTTDLYILFLTSAQACLCVATCVSVSWQVALSFTLMCPLCLAVLPRIWTVPGGINCNPFHEESSLSGNPQVLVPLSVSFIFLSLIAGIVFHLYIFQWNADEDLLCDRNIPPFLCNFPEGLIKDNTLWIIGCIH